MLLEKEASEGEQQDLDLDATQEEHSSGVKAREENSSEGKARDLDATQEENSSAGKVHELDATQEHSLDAEVRDLQVRSWFKLEHVLLYKYRCIVFKPLCAASG